MKRLLTAFLLALSLTANAGYSAKLTGCTGTTCRISGNWSPCMMTVGMAIYQVASGAQTVSVIDTASGAWLGHHPWGYSYSGQFVACASVPAGGPASEIVGGASDPGIVNGQIATGSGGSSADVTALTGQVSALQTQVAALQAANTTNTTALGNLQAVLNEPFELDAALAAFAFFFSTTIFFYGISRAAGQILETIRRPLGRG